MLNVQGQGRDVVVIPDSDEHLLIELLAQEKHDELKSWMIEHSRDLEMDIVGFGH